MKGLTQKGLADQCGITQSGLTGVETGSKGYTEKTFARILGALNIVFEEIFAIPTGSGNILTELMQNHGIERKELSKRSGIPEENIQALEEGRRGLTKENLARFLKAFGMDYGNLYAVRPYVRMQEEKEEEKDKDVVLAPEAEREYPALIEVIRMANKAVTFGEHGRSIVVKTLEWAVEEMKSRLQDAGS